MTHSHEQHLRDLCQQLEAAFTQRGVLQEILLLRLLNKVLSQFAATESDWRTARSLEYRQWREQIHTLLATIDFMISSADSYAQEATGLATESRRISQSVAEIESRLHELTAHKNELTARLNRDQNDLDILQAEVEQLRTLQDLAPFRDALAERLGEQRLRTLANSQLAQAQERIRERAERLMREIETGLGEVEGLLRDNLNLTEQEWTAVRAALRT